MNGSNIGLYIGLLLTKIEMEVSLKNGIPKSETK